MVTIVVEDREGEVQTLDVPTDVGLNLMEVLKAYEYDIAATCGGMALCATCHVQVTEGLDRLPECNDAELALLDTLPDAACDSRLACQIRASESLNGLALRLRGITD
jgi:ferredoxin